MVKRAKRIAKKKVLKKYATKKRSTPKSARKKTSRNSLKSTMKQTPPRQSAKTTRSTGGIGFDFEDKVAALLLSRILLGEQILEMKGNAVLLQMQVKALDWEIDDILFTFEAAGGEQQHLAISCKSNRQVSANGLPKDFVQRAWLQWTKSDGPMNRKTDRLLLVTRGDNQTFRTGWSDIKLWARDTTDKLPLAKIGETAKHRRIFASVREPAEGLSLPASDDLSLDLVRHLDVLATDFDLSPSKDEAEIIAALRRTVSDGTLASARKLWGELKGHARNARLGQGTIDISALWRALRTKVALKDHPDFTQCWERLRALTTAYRTKVRTHLPSNAVLARQAALDDFASKLSVNGALVVFGESGSGKSALVKAGLDDLIPDATQVWLGPDELTFGLNEATRVGFGFDHALVRVLDSSASPNNILVIDAAERLDRDTSQAVKSLVGRLSTDEKAGWRIVVIGQTEAWTGGRLQEISGVQSPPNLNVPLLTEDEVEQALRTEDSLRWLSLQSETVAALRNLRTLGWVMEAASQFPSGGAGTSLPLTAIADRLWEYWTGSKVAAQRLLMRLGEKEAGFQHSFPLGELEGDDARAFDEMPPHKPLRVNSDNRIEFEHDLAADWTRFQSLKQIADDTTRWAPHAVNPLWNNALRMFGQWLLRRTTGGRSSWDVAFEQMDQARNAMPLAADILLDALFLDPEAKQFLNERADMLLANNGARLHRLLTRFVHVASAASTDNAFLSAGRDVGLYLEAEFRMPIVERWPAMAQFLTIHSPRIAALHLPIVAKVCERWLTTMPTALEGGQAVPFRKEFAELALATARELQFGQAISTIYMDDSQPSIYKAALAGAPDLPNDVAEWALEMARRRKRRSDLTVRIQEHDAAREAEHRRKLETDSDYKKRFNRRLSAPVSLSSTRRLPPWPLGPRGRVDREFDQVVAASHALSPLMRTKPDVAAEVLLALIIEDAPEETYGRRVSIDDDIGLKFDSGGYPTGYWKSPFYVFLQLNPTVALAALLELVNFCSERWQASARREGAVPFRTVLKLSDGATHEYVGNFQVFCWSQRDSHHNGRVFSALAALERWLCQLVENGKDITQHIDHLLRHSNSVAILGVLLNVGKYYERLFKGPLRPLMSLHQFFRWDAARVNNFGGRSFDGMTWIRSGEVVFNIARRWSQAAYRQKTLQQIGIELIKMDAGIAEYLIVSSQSWVSPNPRDEKMTLDFSISKALLDRRNYVSAPDVESGDALEFQFPKELEESIARFQRDSAASRAVLRVPDICREWLNGSSTVPAAQAVEFARTLKAVIQCDLDEEFKRAARVAVAAVLLTRASDWLEQNREVKGDAYKIAEAELASIGDEPELLSYHYWVGKISSMEFVAYLVAEEWMTNPSMETDAKALLIITCGDDRAVQVLIGKAHQNRIALGTRYWRLLRVILLWSGLKVLHDEEDGKERWKRWLRWLRGRSLSSIPETVTSIQPLAIARRVEKLERLQRRKGYERDGFGYREIEPNRRLTGGLATHTLEPVLAVLFEEERLAGLQGQELADTITLVHAFWEYESWCRTGSGEDDSKDFEPLQQFGHKIVSTLARLALDGPEPSSEAAWKPVLDLGPQGHYIIGAFLRDWFSLITVSTDTKKFGERWRPMVAYMLQDNDGSTRQRYYGRQLERQILGFGSSSNIARAPNHALLINGLRELYYIWAEKRLRGDGDNLGGFCVFLASEVGRPLRRDGLLWIAASIKGDPHAGSYSRDRWANALIEFLDTIFTEHIHEVAKDRDAREALLDLTAFAVSRQIPAALALQERIRNAL